MSIVISTVAEIHRTYREALKRTTYAQPARIDYLRTLEAIAHELLATDIDLFRNPPR